ncbi:MAG: hypothetical protein O7D91_21270 [Planctomycetota bacterium]|nr:hypothetical protein [Planctomycetota bacterium]
MAKPKALVRDCVVRIITQRKDVLRLASKHRAKFEHWLKFELAAALANKDGISCVQPEKPYLKKGRSDVAFETKAGECCVELKTSNTNWRVEGVVSKTRPITKNISGIIDDIEKLRRCCGDALGLAAFVLFPVPNRIWEDDTSTLLRHLRSIESKALLPRGSLRENASFVPIESKYGVLVFVVDVG